MVSAPRIREPGMTGILILVVFDLAEGSER